MIDKIPTIMCHVCGTPVARCERRDDRNLDAINFRAHCHGATDDCSLPHYYILHPDWRVVEAIAFRPPRPQGQIRP